MKYFQKNLEIPDLFLQIGKKSSCMGSVHLGVMEDVQARVPVTTNNILFPCLDSRRMLPVEMTGGEDLRSIQVHPECVFVATANVGAEYTGTMSLDRDLVGRFFPLELDYMPLECEVQVLTKRCGIRQEDAENIASVAGTVRSLYGKQEISCTISTLRHLLLQGWWLTVGVLLRRWSSLSFLCSRERGQKGREDWSRRYS